ncbi:MAG: FAD-dependent monooxygenase [Chloroflexi bacterium]|nr:FAD-dependent monooxygenase [Chloroflexota bacterium]
MSRIVVLGGGMIGLATAMLLGRQGHDVTVFEKDATPRPASPDAAWEDWDRRGVVQFRQPHFLQPAGRWLLEKHLPEVAQALAAAGCLPFDLLAQMPRSITNRDKRAGDDRFVTLTGRRTTLEFAVATAAERMVQVERGVTVTRLVTGRSLRDGVPHVTGVCTSAGEEVSADLVVDATGRKSNLVDQLVAIGARPPLESTEESAFFYYTRFFRGSNPPQFRAGFLANFHSFSLLTLPGDSGTWSVTVFFFSGDAALKALRDPARWTKLISACPAHAHWLEGEPISDVLPMGGVTDRYRRLMVDGMPVATGVLAVGDALVCTNPVGGRGISIGLMHAVGTAEVVGEYLDDPVELARAHDRMTQARVTPWYTYTVGFDRAHTAQIRAATEGRPTPLPTGPGAALGVAMLHDATLFRAAMEIMGLLALPHEVYARPGLIDRAMKLADVHAPTVPPGPSRTELLRMLAA